ncbi:beta-galactosidase, partial [bacterium]|nr:beta-galactosidase [bacterium]
MREMIMIGARTLRLTRTVCVWLSLLALVVNMPVSSAAAGSMRSIECFNSGWRFIQGDPFGLGDTLSYANVKAWLLPAIDEFRHFQPSGRSPLQARPKPRASYAQPDFDDSRWRALTLPHDWGIEGPFRQEYPGETGKLAWWGIGWYRKAFQIPASDAGKRIYLDIDGAMSYSMVWLNGHWVGGWPYGYSSYRLDLTPWIQPGRENVLAIRLDNPEESSRWYPGGGLYRNVWLIKTDPLHVAHWGVFVTTPLITPQQALVDLQIVVQNDLTEESEAEVVTRLYEMDETGRPTGPPVASAPSTALHVAPECQAFTYVSIPVAAPRLWSLRDPQRYIAITRLSRSGKLCDEVETPFGIRSIAVDSEKGFYLNGERVQFQGVCMHHDLGALGSAIHVRALQRQIEILQEMGCNAIRTSHNPPAPELLELCDRMGMLVMDEAFDCWQEGKKR